MTSLAALIACAILFAVMIFAILRLIATLFWIIVLRPLFSLPIILATLYLAQGGLVLVADRFGLITPAHFYSRAALLCLLWIFFSLALINLAGWCWATWCPAGLEPAPLGWRGIVDWTFRHVKHVKDSTYIPPLLKALDEN
ncbi:MAG TPA: hypothetical protein VF503_06755 [Sphingobium sp.]|uniref:hypothetical protein n=1 Tax=Sphingobium sp. TaxID=1912891 RepID=UPI002ED5E000